MKSKLGWIVAAILAVVLLVMIFLPVAYGRWPGDLYGSQAAQLNPLANPPQPAGGLAPGCECGRGGTGRWGDQQENWGARPSDGRRPPDGLPPQGKQRQPGQDNWPGGQKDFPRSQGKPGQGFPPGQDNQRGPRQAPPPGYDPREGFNPPGGDTRMRPGYPVQPSRFFPGGWLLLGALRLLLIFGLMTLAVLGVVFVVRRWGAGSRPAGAAASAAQNEPGQPLPPSDELSPAPELDEPALPGGEPEAGADQT